MSVEGNLVALRGDVAALRGELVAEVRRVADAVEALLALEIGRELVGGSGEVAHDSVKQTGEALIGLASDRALRLLVTALRREDDGRGARR